MKNASIAFSIAFILIKSTAAGCQELPIATEQQLENLAATEEAEPEDDSYLQQLLQFSKNPLPINTADKNDLKELGLLNDLQIENFIAYRRLLGSITHIYELQAIPSWDIPMIRRILPFITLAVAIGKEEWKKRFTDGNHDLVFRISQTSPGGDQSYNGGPQRIFFRYRYSYKNLLQYGVLGEKDAGESFFSGAQKIGFDFYSFHLFTRKIGLIRALAIGDFTVNMGQGLVQWQSMAFKKSGEVINTKRQSSFLKPYQSAGEFNFHRGIGITLQKNKWELSSFISFRKLTASLSQDSAGNDFFSSFNTSGYHRTKTEVENKNKLAQLATGINIQYNTHRLHAGVNVVGYKFSMPLQKREEPYNLFAIQGTQWFNAGIDYSYTYKNMHFFGEAAICKGNETAWLNGLLISADRRVDLAILYRHIEKEYQALYGNAFTENTSPSNERGIYAGITVRPADNIRFDAYADFYHFPWLRFNAAAPGTGRDFFIQLRYAPDKKTEIIARFRNEAKPVNQPDNTTPLDYTVYRPRQSWRLQMHSSINAMISWRQRAELVWFDKKSDAAETGFLACFDLIIKPLQKPFSVITRLQHFETDGYNARLYAYENDVLFSYAVPVFFDKGNRYYILLNYEWLQNFSSSLRWAHTLGEGVGKKQWTVQLRWQL